MANLGTDRLNIVNDQPSVEQLQNGRYRLEFFLDNDGKKEDWFADNIGNILPAFGTLQASEFGLGHWEPRAGEAYDDMVCIEAETQYVPAANAHYVKLVYETISSTFVAEKDDTTECTTSGLKRITRDLIAVAGTTYSKTVGTSTITADGTTLTLGSYSINDTDASRKIKEIWMEAGVLSVTQQLTEANYRVTVQAFNMTATEVDTDLSEVTTNHVLVSQQDSDYEGIKTSSYSFDLDDFDIIDYELNGLKRLSRELIQAAGTSYTNVVGTSTIVDGSVTLYLASYNIEDTPSYRLVSEIWLEAGTLRTSERNMSEGVKEVNTTFLVIEGTTVGPVTARSTDNTGGLKTISVTTLQDKDGNSIVNTGENLVHSYQQLVPFTYPGVVTIDLTTLTGTGSLYDFEAKDFVLQPPSEVRVEATTYVFFQTSSNITAADYQYDGALGLWNPTEWASGVARGIGWSYAPFSVNKAFRGYRSIPSSYSGTEDGDPWALIIGTRMFQETSWEISLAGGPDAPDGKKYVLDVKISTAFDDVADSTYYKKVITVATIPTQGSDVLT